MQMGSLPKYMENLTALFDFELRSKVWQIYQPKDEIKYPQYDPNLSEAVNFVGIYYLLSVGSNIEKT